MKKITVLLLLLIACSQMKAQDIEVTSFERDVTNLTARSNPVFDNAGEACALLRFFARDKDFIIEPNMGMMKQEVLPGEIRIWVPQGTKRLTIRKNNLMPLIGYEIPERIEAKATYDIKLKVNREANKGHNVYVGAGYNIISIAGPSVALGFDFNHHNIEVGAVFGVNKSDDLYFYDSNSEVSAAYNYKAIRIQLRYGYDFQVTDFFSIMPQVGGAYNLFNGSELVSSSGNYGSGSSICVLGAVRLVTSFNDRFKLHITPEYDISVYKNNSCKVLANYDKNISKWTNGFNLNIGLMYFF